MYCLADASRDIKNTSSKWAPETVGLKEFAWQTGYVAFSVSVTARESAQNDIAKQEEHHVTLSARDEQNLE